MELDIGWGAAFLAGLLSFISPCVLPLVPPYLSFLAGLTIDEISTEADETKAAGNVTGKVLTSALAFVAGFSTVFVALGASASYLGSLVSEYLDILASVAGVIIIILGLHFLGILRIGLLFREARFQTSSRPLGLLGAYVVGLAFAFGWTPCVGPVLAAILFYAGNEADVLKGASLLFVYSLGIGIPFILAAAFVGPFMKLMQRFRQHMGKVEKIMGAFLVITGILFLTGSMSTLSYLMLEWFPSLGTIG